MRVSSRVMVSLVSTCVAGVVVAAAAWAEPRSGSGAPLVEPHGPVIEETLPADPPRATPVAAPTPGGEPAPTEPRASGRPGATPAPAWGPMELLRRTIDPGDKRRLAFPAASGFGESLLDIPVQVVRGERRGPTLCLTAGIHGDELNGVEIVRHVYEHTQPGELAGTLVALPIVNIHGFRRGSRYLPDRRDLNRFFPGSPSGSAAARTAHVLFVEIIRRCDALIDLHTGSLQRTNLPQIRADLEHPGVRPLAVSFGVEVVLDGSGPKGSLRAAAIDAGVPTILYEAGEPLRFEDTEIERGVEGVRNVMAHLGMTADSALPRRQARVYRRTRWVRGDMGGIFRTDRRLGDHVTRGEILGTVTDPITNERERIVAPADGRIVGMATPQVVLSGFALFHLGLGADDP